MFKKYIISYFCATHVGRCRKVNQDNLICNGRYLEINEANPSFHFNGCMSVGKRALFGAFDGMGGEECGEIAAYIAAKDAANISVKKNSVETMKQYCKMANADICQYANVHSISSMGSTNAMISFSKANITICNIGDSKIFRFSNNKLQQISVDHISVAAYGMKPPLMQNLGILPSELMIQPYIAQGNYRDGDVYLICTDGLTDMLMFDEIEKILRQTKFENTINRLQEEALSRGGKDNITILLCRINCKRFKKRKVIMDKEV